MKRFALLAAACLVAASCGDAGGETGTQPAATTAAPVATTEPARATTTPSTEPAPAGIVPGEDLEVDAIVAAFTTAFDSVSSFEDKAAFIDDPSGLESTVAGYIDAGETFGGIGVLVTSVAINGDEADVFYDLLFGGNPTYPNLEGKVVRGDAGWQVPRVVFCGLMASARVPCS